MLLSSLIFLSLIRYKMLIVRSPKQKKIILKYSYLYFQLELNFQEARNASRPNI
jgi:hypothetical protein